MLLSGVLAAFDVAVRTVSSAKDFLQAHPSGCEGFIVADSADDSTVVYMAKQLRDHKRQAIPGKIPLS